MLRLERPELAPSTTAALDAMTKVVQRDDSPSWEAFRASRVRSTWKVFGDLWTVLVATGHQKCALCEAPHPDTVEHIVPKGTARGGLLRFVWKNLLPACSTCNRSRENSRVETLPIDPCSCEPLDLLGWDENGEFTANPAHASLVRDTVRAYGLDRFKYERARQLMRVRFLLALALREEPVGAETERHLREELQATTPWLGPVREYLLRPPSAPDRALVAAVYTKLPWLDEVVTPWLRPPAWATCPCLPKVSPPEDS